MGVIKAEPPRDRVELQGEAKKVYDYQAGVDVPDIKGPTKSNPKEKKLSESTTAYDVNRSLAAVIKSEVMNYNVHILPTQFSCKYYQLYVLQ